MLHAVQQHATATSTATAWATLPDVDDVEPRSEKDEIIFQEIRAVLQRHGALHRFGITLNHRHFDLQPGEVIFETTDVEQRRQIIEPRAAQDVVGQPNILETQWMFDGKNGTLFCVGFCDYNRGHKRIHEFKKG